MGDLHGRSERRENAALREIVEKAILLGQESGFVDAADFMYAAQVPTSVVLRLLANIDNKNPWI